MPKKQRINYNVKDDRLKIEMNKNDKFRLFTFIYQ